MEARTTVRLNQNLMLQAKKLAAKRRTTFTALVEEALRELLLHNTSEKPVASRIVLPVSGKGGGVRTGVDINNSAQLLDIMEGYVDPS